MAYKHTWRVMFDVGMASVDGVDVSADRCYSSDGLLKFVHEGEDGFTDTLLAALHLQNIASVMLWDDEESPFIPIK